jgi:hypothetical protein
MTLRAHSGCDDIVLNVRAAVADISDEKKANSSKELELAVN